MVYRGGACVCAPDQTRAGTVTHGGRGETMPPIFQPPLRFRRGSTCRERPRSEEMRPRLGDALPSPGSEPPRSVLLALPGCHDLCPQGRRTPPPRALHQTVTGCGTLDRGEASSGSDHMSGETRFFAGDERRCPGFSCDPPAGDPGRSWSAAGIWSPFPNWPGWHNDEDVTSLQISISSLFNRV